MRLQLWVRAVLRLLFDGRVGWAIVVLSVELGGAVDGLGQVGEGIVHVDAEAPGGCRFVDAEALDPLDEALAELRVVDEVVQVERDLLRAQLGQVTAAVVLAGV